MIDFIKLHWGDKYILEKHVVKQGNFEELLMVLEKHSGEIRYPYTTELMGMKIGITKKTGYLKNSLHKSYNLRNTQVSQNYNNFTYSQLCDVIEYLVLKVANTNNSKITQLEFGLNIPLDTSAENVITSNILFHKLKGANHNRTYFGRGKLKQFDYFNYGIKIYDKAKQYRLPTPILRFEIKFINSVEFQKVGVFNIIDLKNKKNLRLLFLFLKHRFDELTIIDSYTKRDMNKKDWNLLRKYTNQLFWEEELRKKSRQTKSRHKAKFERLLVENNLLKTKKNLKKLIMKKFIYLINN